MRAPSIKKRVDALRHHIDRKLPEEVTARLFLQWDSKGNVFVFKMESWRGSKVATYPGRSLGELDWEPLVVAHYTDGWRRIVPRILLAW